MDTALMRDTGKGLKLFVLQWSCVLLLPPLKNKQHLIGVWQLIPLMRDHLPSLPLLSGGLFNAVFCCYRYEVMHPSDVLL